MGLVAEMKINHDDGHLWTRLSDGTDVVGDKDLVTEAPLDGEHMAAARTASGIESM